MATVTPPAHASTQAAPSSPRRGMQRNTLALLIIVAAIVLFLAPLLASAWFGFSLPSKGFTMSWVQPTLEDPDFGTNLWLTVQLAILTTVLALIIIVPTLLYVHLKAPKLMTLVEGISVVPFVVPAVALVNGVGIAFNAVAPEFLVSDYSLVPLYVVLALPLVFRSLDAGIRALDIRTLFDASAALGSTPAGTLWRVVLPNLREAMLTSALLTTTLVLGEYAVASLLLHHTFPTLMARVGQSQPQAAAALAFITIIGTALILFVVAALAQPKSARAASAARKSPTPTDPS